MKKSISYFFKKTYGISHSLSFKMCSFIHVAPRKRAEKVSDLKKKQAFQFLQTKTGLNLKKVELKAFLHYDLLNHIKGFKFRCLLPINGQRNKRNAKTARKKAISLLKLLGKNDKNKKNSVKTKVARG